MKKIIFFSLMLLAASCRNHQSLPKGLSTQEALKTFQLPEGYQIELVAAEPLVADPVAMEIDEKGNFYVVEMHGYPEDLKGSGVIKLLRDTDRDGWPDQSIVFADSLVLPTGIIRWKKGVLVVDVPHVWYLEDSTGDGHADIKRKMLTGFSLTNPQHIANTPLLAPDNWIYVAHQGAILPKVSMLFNDTGTLVRYADRPDGPVLPRDADGRNIRFKPNKDQLEMLSGESQYGHTFDTWGHHLCTSNANHLFHEVIAAPYLKRNPSLLLADATQNIPDHGDAAEVYPITKNPEHQLLTDVGVITSSCGVTWYQGDCFPDSFHNVTFIAEPVHNLVHADKIVDRGATFTASRLLQQKEFLSSTDAWFRPVQFYIGPDGALYVIDYYRQIVEHPEWMSEEVNRSGALYNGSDKGRIYRVTPKGTPAPAWCTQLQQQKTSPDYWVSLLAHRSIWWRRTAQRLISDQGKETYEKLLHQFIDTTTSAAGVVHALWLLHDFSSLTANELDKALRHPVAGVRENGIRLAEFYLSQWSGLSARILSLVQDPDAKVRYQLLCSLGELSTPAADQARHKILLRDIEDDWVQIAALTATRSPAEGIVSLRTSSAAMDRYVEKASALVALSDQETALRQIMAHALEVRSAAPASIRSAILAGMVRGLEARHNYPASLAGFLPTLAKQLNAQSDERLRNLSLQLYTYLVKKGVKPIAGLADRAARIAADTSLVAAYRADALRLLVTDSSERTFRVLEQVIQPSSPQAVQQQAIHTYSRLHPLRAGNFYIRVWSGLSHELREEALETFYASPGAEQLLLDAVEQKKIMASHISWQRSVWLMNEDNEKVRKRARKLLSSAAATDRDAIIKQYTAALELKGDPGKGHELFQINCSTCHRMNGAEGIAFGPDLASIRNRDPRFIMADILNPNRSIADKYEWWTIILLSGERVNGIISAETSATLTLTQAGGKTLTLSRSAIRSMESSTTSAMPSGFEAALPVQDMAHLLAYLKGEK